jgi:hypothetical protein
MYLRFARRRKDGKEHRYWSIVIHDRPHVRPPLAPAAFGGRDQRLDMRPFVIGQVARISQVIAVVLRPVLVRPHWRPLESKIKEGVHRIQVIRRNQEVFGRTLSNEIVHEVDTYTTLAKVEPYVHCPVLTSLPCLIWCRRPFNPRATPGAMAPKH